MMKINNIKRYFKEKISLNRIKLTAIAVSLLLLVTFVLPVFSEIASAQNYPVLSGTTYLNMPEETFGGETTTCKLTITNFDINNNKFSLAGILSYLNRNYPLSIQGTLYKSRIGKDNFVALAKDKTNNFNVLHFSILFHPDKHFLVTKKIRDLVSKQPVLKTDNPFPIITLYLQRKNTREISFVEGEISGSTKALEEKFNSIFLSIVSSSATHVFKRSVFGTDVFLHKIFKPTDVVSGSNNVTTKSSSTQDKSMVLWHRETYSVDGGNYVVYLYIEYTIQCSAPTFLDGQASTHETVTVTKNYTDIYDYGETERLYNEPFSLGKPDNPVTFEDKLYYTAGGIDKFESTFLRQTMAEMASSPIPELDVNIGPLSIPVWKILYGSTYKTTIFYEYFYKDSSNKITYSNSYYLMRPDSHFDIESSISRKDPKNTGNVYQAHYSIDTNVPIYEVQYNGTTTRTFTYVTNKDTLLEFLYDR